MFDNINRLYFSKSKYVMRIVSKSSFWRLISIGKDPSVELQEICMQMSQLHSYSIGVAAENKPLDTRHLNVCPIEMLSAVDGEINFDPQEQVVRGIDSRGNSYEVKVTMDNSVTAEWYPGASNRVTPPDIRRGELIEIYRLGDTDKFYWRCMGLRDNLRRLETVIWAFNGTSNENDKGIDYDTSYFFEVSTHKKLITMSTSQANGEPFRYTFQFNTGDGHVLLTDDVGNHVLLDSAHTNIHLENIEGTMVELNRQDINFYAPNDVNGLVDNDVNLQVGNNMNIDVVNDINVTAGMNINYEAGVNFDLQAGMDISTAAGNNSNHTAGMNYSITAQQMASVTAMKTATVMGQVSAALVSGGNGLNVTPAGIAMTGGGSTMGMSPAGVDFKAPAMNMEVGSFNVKKG
jgi:hypothetical protein